MCKNKIKYNDLINIENLKKGLERTKNNVSPGLDGKIKSQITEKRLIKLHNELSSQKYKPTPSKRVGIPRSDGVLVIWVSLHKLIRLYKAQFLIN